MKPGAWRMPLRWQAAWSQASWVGLRLMVGYRALELGADAFAIGILAASFALPAVVTALPAGRLSDRRGGSIVAFAGLGFATIGLALSLVVASVVWLLAACVIIGLGHLLVMVGQQSLVAHISHEDEADGAFGTLTAAASLGQLIGPAIATLVAAAAPVDLQSRAGLFTCLLCTVLAMLGSRALRKQDPRASAVSPPLNTHPGALSRKPGLIRALLVGAAVIATVDLLYSFLPVWGRSQDVPVWAVGALLSLRAVVSIASRLGLSALVRRFGRRTLLVVALTVGTVSMSALPFVDEWGACLVMIGLGIALGVPQPVTMSWITRLTPPGAHGAVLGVRMTVNRIAQLTIPIVVGAAAGPVGVAGVFLATAVLLCGAAVATATSGPEALPPGKARPASA